jgi:hypothetical protein
MHVLGFLYQAGYQLLRTTSSELGTLSTNSDSAAYQLGLGSAPVAYIVCN